MSIPSGNITDPALLEQLNEGSGGLGGTYTANPSASGAVTDTALLEKLNDAWSADNINPHDVIDTLTYEVATGEEVDASDWKKTVAGISASIAASIPQGRKGYEWGQRLTSPLPRTGWFGVVKGVVPVITGAVRGSLASGAALGATEFSYDAVESLVSGEDFDPGAALDAAWDAAQTDALWSAGASLGFPIVGQAYKKGRNLVKDVIPKRTPIPGKAGLADDSINQIVKLQAQLKEMGASLLPSMVTDKKLPGLMEQVAKVSKFTRGTVENYFQIYGQFMGKQVDEMVNMFASQSIRKQGQVLQAFITQNELALAKIVDPLYKGIAIKGGKVRVNLREQAKSLAEEISQSGPYRAFPKTDEAGNVILTKEGEEILQDTAKGKVKQVIDELRNMPDDLNFYEAHQKLSKIKSDIADLRKSTNPDSAAIRELEKYQALVEEGMDEAASRLSPTLQKEYAEVTAYYKRGKEMVGNEWLKSALKAKDPATIGRILTQDGLSEGIIQIKELRKIAAQFKKDLPKPPKGASEREIAEYNQMIKGLDVDPLEGIRRGFLEEMLRTSADDAIPSVQKFADKLKNPRFRETFDELFKGTPLPAKMDEVLENLKILSRTDQAQQGFALTLAGAEQKALTEPRVSVIFKSLMPAFFAAKQITPRDMDRLINLQKVAIQAQNQGVELSPQFYASLQKLMQRGQVTGTIIGTEQN